MMAITFPLALAAFADKLRTPSVKFKLQDNDEVSGLGSGQIITHDLAPKLWTGELSTVPMRTNEARELEALVNIVKRGSFYLYDPRKAVPAKDPYGSLLGGSVVQINSLPNAYSMSLKGLPAGYVLLAGDYLSFDYGSPTRRAFHEVAETVTANGSGVTPVFEVGPFIRPGAAVDAIVTLRKPSMRAIIVPGSFDASFSVPFTTINFSVIQKA